MVVRLLGKTAAARETPWSWEPVKIAEGPARAEGWPVNIVLEGLVIAGG